MVRLERVVHRNRTQQPSTWLAVGLLVSCVLVPATAHPQGEKGPDKCVPTRDGTILKSRENELRATAERLLQAFRAKDTKTFLGLVHLAYFSMAESRNYTSAELKESFRTKEEMYCFLFDASCIPPPAVNETTQTSFNEMARRPEARVQAVEIWLGEHVKEPGCRGSVNFAWTDPVDPAHVSTFTFMYVGGQWKTVGFDFPPTALPPGPRVPPEQAGDPSED